MGLDKPTVHWIRTAAISAFGVILSLTWAQGACSRESEIKLISERTVLASGTVVQKQGPLKKGQKHGTWSEYRNGKLRRIETWKDGVLHGPERAYFDGLLSMDIYHRNGVPHGRSRLFQGDDNGLTELHWWVRGRQHGVWCFWRDDGQLKKIKEYRDGNLIRTDESPRQSCPYMSLSMGQHHFDPDDRTYLRPYPQSSHRSRPMPLPNR